MRFEAVQTCLFNPLHVLLWIHSLIAFVFDTKCRELTGVKEKDGKHSIYIWEEMKSFSHTLYDSISYIFYQLVAAAQWSFASLLLPCTQNSAWHIMSAPREFKNNILQVWTVNLKTLDPPVGVVRFEFAHIGCCSSRSLLFRKFRHDQIILREGCVASPRVLFILESNALSMQKEGLDTGKRGKQRDEVPSRIRFSEICLGHCVCSFILSHKQ